MMTRGKTENMAEPESSKFESAEPVTRPEVIDDADLDGVSGGLGGSSRGLGQDMNWQSESDKR